MLSKIIVVLSCLLAAAFSDAVDDAAPKIVVNPDGSFQWSYDARSSSQEQSGQQLGPEGGQAVQGSAQWYDPEGGFHQVQYTADENGYQPTSNDVPVGPDIPPAILRSLEWNAAHPEEEDKQA